MNCTKLFLLVIFMLLISDVFSFSFLRRKRSSKEKSDSHGGAPDGSHGGSQGGSHGGSQGESHGGSHGKTRVKSNSTRPTLYNPFGDFQVHTTLYLIAAAFVILFMFVRLGTEIEFNYCCLVRYRGCEYSYHHMKQSTGCCKRVCTTHRTSAGSIVPESTFLVTVGIIPAVLVLISGEQLEGKLNPDIVFNILLIPIIMSAAWVTDKLTFYRNIGTILWFAIVGTVVNAAILMPFFYYGSKSRWGIFTYMDMDEVDSGMYAILICAVDPVAVLAVFEAMHIDKTVYNVVFGESLLNDGVAVVFYHAFNDLRTLDNIMFYESIGIMFIFFVYAFTLSVILGFIMAMIISFITKLFYHHQPMQFVVILSLNYLTYLIGDTIKASGIISLFFCVLFQRQYVMANLTYTSQVMIQQILSQLGLLSEGVIFILMGLTSFAPTGLVKNTDIGFTLFLIFLCYVSRYFVVFLLGTIANIFRNEKLDYKRALFIQSHGGLRGAIGFSLALTIEDYFPNRYYYQSATAIMVFFSVYILGTTVKPLVNLCKIKIESHKQQTVFIGIQGKVCDRTKEAIKAIIGSSSMRFRWENGYTYFNNRYLKKWLMSTKALERSVSHSSVVKIYRDQSVSEAQEIAGSHGSIVMKDVFGSDGDPRLKLYRKTWSSFASLISNPQKSGKFQDEFDTHLSIPDMSVLDTTMSRRDVDDQMTHHSRQEGVGRKWKKTDSVIMDVEKIKNKTTKCVENFRSHVYKIPRRVIGIKNKVIDTDSNFILAKMQKTFYDQQPKMNSKSVTFHDIELNDVRPVFKLGERDKPLSELVDKKKPKVQEKNDYNAYIGIINKAFEDDENVNNYRRTSRNISTVYDPFVGRINDDHIFGQELPWQRNCENDVPQRSNEPAIPGVTTENSGNSDQTTRSSYLNENHTMNITYNPLLKRRRPSHIVSTSDVDESPNADDVPEIVIHKSH